MTIGDDAARKGRMEPEDSLAGALSDLAKAQAEIAALDADRKKLAAKLERALKRLDVLEEALQPRLKSILSLRPLRFAFEQRNRIKRGEPVADIALENQADDKPQPDAAITQPTAAAGDADWKGLGIAVFAHTRANCVRNTLESLARQDALHVTHVFIDGDQGKPGVRSKVDRVGEAVSAYPVKQIHRQRGAFGFRKMMLVAGDYMRQRYSKLLFLEDDCFPISGAVAEFSRELSEIENNENIFSVYGHHFLVEGENESFGRFQGWGWGTTSEKLAPIWRQLRECYLMSEPEYLSFVNEKLSPDIIEAINATPGRQPTDTLTKFFAWDETVCLLTALAGQKHKRSDRRLIYNCGAGLESTHFANLRHFRNPPFNMISEDEVWRYF